jgi:hypothetical protein
MPKGCQPALSPQFPRESTFISADRPAEPGRKTASARDQGVGQRRRFAVRWLCLRLTVFRLLLVIAVSAILLHGATDPLRSRARERHERCMEIVDTHARLAAEYRRNAGGDAGMLLLAAWHEHMRREFKQATEQPQMPLPSSQPFPPRAGRPRPPRSDESVVELADPASPSAQRTPTTTGGCRPSLCGLQNGPAARMKEETDSTPHNWLGHRRTVMWSTT